MIQLEVNNSESSISQIAIYWISKSIELLIAVEVIANYHSDRLLTQNSLVKSLNRLCLTLENLSSETDLIDNKLQQTRSQIPFPCYHDICASTWTVTKPIRICC